ncbi:hypothetical protein [Saccharopolyspora cebuensis]|uniref:HNH endonuclease n=1 Tax=Saccharopolyspora cebuensis TaxID=418759 RepID=A0ABV4CJH1_9PSEU
MATLSRELIKQLFNRARTCANPKCPEPVVRKGDHLAVNVQMAHIRSGKKFGPRYDECYPVDWIDCEKNVFLLCVGCHREVDRNPDAYPTTELLSWKSAQVLEGAGDWLTARELAEIYTQMSVMIELEQTTVVRGSATYSPLDTASPPEFSEPVEARYLCVAVRNDGFASAGVDAVGVDMDMGGAVGAYLFPRDSEKKELQGCSSSKWIADPKTIIAGLGNAMHETGMLHPSRFPTRLRGYVLLGSGARIHGEWIDFARLTELVAPDGH